MKFLFFLVAIVSIFTFSSCKKDSTPSITADQVSTTAKTGTWRVTFYSEAGVTKTSNFSGFTFTFAANNVVSASNNILNVNGTWTTGVDDSKVKLYLTFSNTNIQDFISISDDWEVIERTDTKIRLQDISGGNGGTDYLTFERN